MKTNNILTPLLLIFLFSQVKSNLFNKIDFTSEKQILFESYLDNGYNQFEIETSKYNTGTYVYNVLIDGQLVKSGKFIKVK